MATTLLSNEMMDEA